MSLPLVVGDLEVGGEGDRRLLQIPLFTVGPGQCVGVRGPSGAGKSTLLFALAGLAPRSSGVVRWGATDITALNAGRRAAFRRAHIGMIFQDFLLFEELGAIANANLAAAYARPARRADINRRAGAMLERLGVGTGVARTVETFSGGERQRVAVARALAHDPEVLLADEPTASLDRAAADRLVEDLIDITRAARNTLIVVSHDTSVHCMMDRVIDLFDGRIVADSAGGG